MSGGCAIVVRMDTSLYFAMKVIHLLGMAVWIGGSVVAHIDLQHSARLGAPHDRALLRRLELDTVAIVGSALVTVLSGFALIVAAGGVGHVRLQILAGAGLTFPIFALGAGLGRPTLRRLRAHFDSGGDSLGAQLLFRRFERVITVEMALRLAVLVLMVFPLGLSN